LAVDGDGVTLTTDQRGVGFPRLAGATVDMGAFERQSCIFPTSVGDEAALNDAITCFNAITVPSSYTIKLSDNIVDSIVLTGDTTTIDNATAGVALLIDGNGKTLDGNDAYRPLDIAANTTVAIQNLTVTGGNVNNSGGGVQNLGDLTITNSTLSGNRASGEGGGVYEASGTVTLNNAIITNSTSGGDCAIFDGIEFSGSSNLIDDTTGPCAGATFRLGAVTNFETTLGDNGGPTLTHALLTGSNAINAIPLSVARLDGTQSANVVCDGLVPDTDQRGVTRPQGSGCDIGAFELANPLAVTLGWFLAERNGASVNFRWQTATETGTAGFHVLAATDDGNTVQLNQKLIPSLVIDSITPTDYAFNAVTDATGFYLEEMGVDGGVTRHGPFELGVEYGAYALPGNVEVRPAVFLPVVAR
jgi:hypothetical protein